MYLFFDIGATQIKLAISKNGQGFNTIRKIPTPAHFTDGIAIIEQYYKKNIKTNTLTAAIGGIAGLLDTQHSTTLCSPNLPSWDNMPIKKELTKKLRTKVFLENDADLAGLGEAVYGPGKEYDICAYLTVSTGIGGVRIVNKSIDRSAHGFEPGHQIINTTPPRTLEYYIGGRALEKRHSAEPHTITNKKVWHDATQKLGIGLNNLVMLWSPEIIILGGGQIHGSHYKITDIKKALQDVSTVPISLPKLVKSRYKDNSAFYGARALIAKMNS